MTESEWLDAIDHGPMLEALQAAARASQRKVRLWSVACVRRVWPLLTDPRSRQAVEVAERYADGLARGSELRDSRVAADDAAQAVEAAFHARTGRHDYTAGQAAAVAAHDTASYAVFDPRGESAVYATGHAAYAFAASCAAAGEAAEAHRNKAMAAEEAVQAVLLRDLFGPLLFREVRVDLSWLAWNGGTVRRLAAAAYEERALPEGTLDAGRLGVLADALEDSGCHDREVLGHLREQGAVHVRGCWVVDLVLGKS
jgi:hypothetical protein